MQDMIGAPDEEPAAGEDTTDAASPAEEAAPEKKAKSTVKLYKKKIIKKGKGKDSMPKKGNTVRCHYVSPSQLRQPA